MLKEYYVSRFYILVKVLPVVLLTLALFGSILDSEVDGVNRLFVICLASLSIIILTIYLLLSLKPIAIIENNNFKERQAFGKYKDYLLSQVDVKLGIDFIEFSENGILVSHFGQQGIPQSEWEKLKTTVTEASSMER